LLSAEWYEKMSYRACFT